MECGEIVFSGHAVRRMSERQISDADLASAIAGAETIASYPDDEPYPSRMLLGFVGHLPLHLVVAGDRVS